MKPVVWLIGGTSEGRALIKAMANLQIELFVSVATDYGATLIEPQRNLTVLAERMDLQKMRTFLQNHRPACVIDATHPYAAIVTATVQEACTLEEIKYLRLLRPVGIRSDCIYVSDFDEAVELLNHLEGNIFLTTGSKNLRDFTAVRNYKERISLRVLPMESSLASAINLGYKPANIVCMQGPFSKEMNIATLKKFGSKFMVTKDSGTAGGFEEKLAAAKEAGAKIIVVGRQAEEQGEGYEEILKYLQANFAD